MYKKIKQVATTSGTELELFVEGFDLFGSNLLYKLALDPEIEKEDYTIKTSYRPDLIAKEYYGSELYESFVIIQLGKLSAATQGTTIKLIPKRFLERIMKEA